MTWQLRHPGFWLDACWAQRVVCAWFTQSPSRGGSETFNFRRSGWPWSARPCTYFTSPRLALVKCGQGLNRRSPAVHESHGESPSARSRSFS